MNATCPACKEQIFSLQGDSDDISFGAGLLKCIVFKCPKCLAVLSAQVDPIAIRSDIIAAMRRG